MRDENSYAWQMAEAWDYAHDVMPPFPTPDGYKSTYEYKTAVVGTRPVQAPYILSVEPGEDWGVISMTSDHLLDELEIRGMMLEIKNYGLECPGELRLILQSFRLDI